MITGTATTATLTRHWFTNTPPVLLGRGCFCTWNRDAGIGVLPKDSARHAGSVGQTHLSTWEIPKMSFTTCCVAGFHRTPGVVFCLRRDSRRSEYDKTPTSGGLSPRLGPVGCIVEMRHRL
jgi:hypothetical protein